MTDSSTPGPPVTRRQLRERAEAQARPIPPRPPMPAQPQEPRPPRQQQVPQAAPPEPSHDSTQIITSSPRAVEAMFASDKHVRPPLPNRRRRRIVGLAVVAGVLALVAIGVFAIGNAFGPQIAGLFASKELDDFADGEATGEATVLVTEGDTGETVSQTLFDAGVTKTPTVFYEMLLHTEQNPIFIPGAYEMQTRMTSAAALDRLQDEDARASRTVLIREGEYARDVFESLAAALGVPVADVQAAAEAYVEYGVPAEAPSIEGYLFPATYEFAKGTTPEDALREMVATTNARLDAEGVPDVDRFRVLTEAALVQREASSQSDMRKVARVFMNRDAEGILFQSDATVTYGTGNDHTVWTEDDERADDANPYNTYQHYGWPPGPIGNPGLEAIDAVLHPADGAWLYFVTVNLATGETAFTNTLAEHEAAVEQLRAWCQESAENEKRCD